MTSNRRLNRRNFLYGSAAVAGGLAGVPALGSLAQTPSASPPLPSSFQESPLLADAVSKGTLPSVEKRLPATPVVLTPVEGVGTYGGDWLTATSSQGSGYESRTMGYENLVRWAPGDIQFTTKDVIPNVAERFEVNDDGSEYTFHLRKGMKWSDGEPFTSADFTFWYEDVVVNKDLSPVIAEWLSVNGDPVVVEAPDDLTVIFRFPGPNGLFLQRLATNLGEQMTAMPAHYLKKFHLKYNDRVKAEAKKQELDDWMALFWQQAAWRNNADMPVLFAWKMTTPIGDNPSRFIASRNPYYWKVDTEGNQLPYLDRVVFNVVTEPEVMLLQALNGELDLVTDYVNELQNKPVFFDNKEKGGFDLYDISYTQQARTVICFNMVHKDAKRRAIYANKDFRVGLSHALNRQEIIDAVYVSQGEPFQLAPRPESPFYNEELAKQYTEYDVDKANEYLDKVLPDKDNNGMRLGPDGKPFLFQVEFASEFRAEWASILEFAAQHWKAVGIQMTPKSEERGLLEERRSANEHDAVVWEGEGGREVMLDPRYYFPHSIWSYFAIPWANWYQQGGTRGDADVKNADMPMAEPPEGPKKQMQLFDEIQQTADPDQQADLMKQILDIAVDQFYCLGITLPTGGFGAVKRNFHNVQKPMTYAWLAQTPALTNPCTFFKSQ